MAVHTKLRSVRPHSVCGVGARVRPGTMSARRRRRMGRRPHSSSGRSDCGREVSRARTGGCSSARRPMGARARRPNETMRLPLTHKGEEAGVGLGGFFVIGSAECGRPPPLHSHPPPAGADCSFVFLGRRHCVVLDACSLTKSHALERECTRRRFPALTQAILSPLTTTKRG